MTAPPLWHRYDGPMNDASAATLNLLRGLNVAAAPRSVAGYVTAHPAFPSLAAVVDALAEFGVRASARRIAAEGLSSVTAPALVHVRDDSATGAFWLLSGQRDGRFLCRLPDGEEVHMAHDELAARYLGIVVSGSAEPAAGERYAARNELGDRLRTALPRAARALFWIALGVSCAAASFAPPGLFGPAVLFSFAGFGGLGLTLYLGLREHLGGSGLLSKLCPTGKTFNCTSVVGSAGGHIGGVISLADAGAAFFLAQIAAGAAAVLSGYFAAFLALFLFLGVVLVPVIVYSVVQQGMMIRRWCPLCLLVDAVLVVELATAAHRARLDDVAALDARGAVLLVGSALIAAMAYAVARPLVPPALRAPGLHAELESLRGVPEVVAAALARTAPVTSDVAGKLRQGNDAAPLELLVVSHPFCVACADAHTAVRRLVEAFPELVRSATVFSVPDTDLAAAGAARSLLAGSSELGAWYARVNENVEAWIRRGAAAEVAPEQAATLAAQRAFADRLGVSATPAIVVDGRPLPAGFGLRHLRFYLRAEQRRRRAAGAPARESA